MTANDSVPPTSEASEAEGADRALVLEFAELWNRGLADVSKLWQLFDLSEMFMQRPDYFGAPVFNTGTQMVSPVFSDQKGLALFMAETGQIDLEDADDGYDWVRITGAKFFGLPVRAKYLFIDPGSEHGAIVDLSSREDLPPLANGAPPIGINLELLPDGTISNGLNMPESVAKEKSDE